MKVSIKEIHLPENSIHSFLQCIFIYLLVNFLMTADLMSVWIG